VISGPVEMKSFGTGKFEPGVDNVLMRIAATLRRGGRDSATSSKISCELSGPSRNVKRQTPTRRTRHASPERLHSTSQALIILVDQERGGISIYWRQASHRDVGRFISRLEIERRSLKSSMGRGPFRWDTSLQKEGSGGTGSKAGESGAN